MAPSSPTSFLAVICAGVCLISVVVNSQSSDAPPSPPPGKIQDVTQFNCKKVMMIIAKKQLKVFGQCMREHKDSFPDATEYQERIQCVVKCALDKESLLDTDKQITAASIQHFMDAHVPQMFHEMGHMFVDNCKSEFDGKMDDADPNCKSYGEFVKCMQSTLADLC